MKKAFAYCICFLLFFSFSAKLFSQPVPSEDEKIPYLQTFSKSALAGFGDDDFVQIFFFVVPENCKEQVFIKVFDPEVGGKIDENRGGFNSKTKFTIYGGAGAHSAKEAKTNTPTGNYKTGISLATKIFDASAEYDEKWYVFGPF
ncbi:MAG: hypothetical protein IAF38_15990, partial [Bacteroidia bacterium]|nr:hypothetical protein [Bacteroidia bacterium]